LQLIDTLRAALAAFLFTVPLFAAVPQAAHPVANEDVKRDPDYGETVVVTATRNERPGENVPMSVTVVPASSVAEAPSRTVDDLLRTVIGVNLPFGNSLVQFPDSNKVSMRGLGGHRALVLLDGIPINDAYYSYVQWNKIPTAAVEQIEVVRGATASLYGNYALGGAIHLVTRPAVEDELMLAVESGSFGTSRGVLSAGHAFGEKLGLRLDAESLDSDGYSRLLAADRGAIDDASWSDSDNVQLRADFKPAERFHGFVRAGWFTMDLSQGTTLSSTSRRILDLAASTHLATGRSGDFHTTAFYQDQNLDVVSTATVPGRGVEWVSNISDIPIRDLGGSVEWSGALSNDLPLVTIGADVHRADATDTRDIFSRPGALVAVRGNAGAQDFAGAFAQMSWAPSSRFEVLGSVRADSWKNYDGREFGPEGTTRYPARSKTVVNPRVSVRWTAGRTALRGAVYTAFKAPGLRDLYRTTQFAGLVILPNPGLDPESLKGIEAGVDYRRGRVSGQINFFDNEIDDLITRVALSISPDVTFQPRNVGTARSRGVEVMGSASLPRGWSVSAGFTHVDSTVVDNPLDPSLEGKRTPEVPEDAGTLRLEFHQHAYRGTLGATWMSESFSDAANSLALDGHTIVDLGAGVNIRPSLELYTKITNLFDETYLVDYSIGRRLGEPRSLNVGMRWTRSSR
jgi:outer membrane receptor protein involved in Fe transport